MFERDTRSVLFRKEHKPEVSVKRVVRRIIRAKEKEEAEERGKLHNDEAERHKLLLTCADDLL